MEDLKVSILDTFNGLTNVKKRIIFLENICS